jgi:glycosyltransferase involved in cell wall biosynthesis
VRPVRVLGFGTFDLSVHPRAAVLLEGMRAAGDEVVVVNEPLGLDTASRVAMLRRPWRVPVLVLRLLLRWSVLLRRVRGRRTPDVVVVGYLGHFDVHLARRRFPRSLVVLDHLISASDTAKDRGAAGGVLQRILVQLDARACRAADVVVVDTDEHRDVLPAAARPAAVVVPVGAPFAWHAPAPAPRPPGTPLRVVFFGLYTPLQGASTIGAALARLAGEPGIEVHMIGSGQDLEAARRAASANPRVHWSEWVDYDRLPALLAESDVCLGIFGTSPKALRVVPNKVYQGAAAGCVVLTSDTPPQRRALDGAAEFVPPGDAAALAESLRRLAVDPERVVELRRRAWRRAQRSFRPEAVVAPLRAEIAARSVQRPAVPPDRSPES